MAKTAEEIAAAIGDGKHARQGSGWVTLCPAHADSSPSLSISDKGGKVLVKCHAGCSQAEVIKALTDRGLWEAKAKVWRALPYAPEGASAPAKDRKHAKFGRPSRRWEYRDAQGRLVGFIYRFDLPGGGKDLVPCAWCVCEETGETGWQWKSFPKPRPLYNAHLINQRPQARLLLVEGEKTADAAAKIFPELVVVTWPGGSNAVKFTDWSLLRGRHVTIWPDADLPGRKTVSTIGEILVVEGAGEVRAVDLPTGLPKGWDLADAVPEGVSLDPAQIYHQARDFAPSGDMLIDEYNRQFALVVLGDKVAILWEKFIGYKVKRVVEFLGKEAFSTLKGNEYVQVGKQQVAAPTYWLRHEHRRTYNGVVFEPQVDVGSDHFNLWRGFSVEPDQTGDFSILDEHLRQNVALGDESLYRWVVGWFAQMCQQPNHKPGTSLALRGHQGTGKTVIGEHVGQLFRDHYVYVDDDRYVTGQFNSHMITALLLQADEAFFAGDPRIVGRLKGLVTSQTNMIEKKGKDQFEVTNYIRLLLTSNEAWVLPAAFEERRFAVLDVGDGRRQDNAYFEAMANQLKAGGYGGLLHYLLNFDLSTTDVHRIPRTAALEHQKQQSFHPTVAFWHERLVIGDLDWGQTCDETWLYQKFIEAAQSWGQYRRPTKLKFREELEAVMPPSFRLTRNANGRWAYNLGSHLEAVAHFEQVTRVKVRAGSDVLAVGRENLPF